MSATILPRAAWLLPLMLAACAVTPEQKVRTALIEAGLSDGVARCMAKPMAHKLSLSQLRALKRLGSLAQDDGDAGTGGGKRMTPKRILRKVAALDDPEILAVTGRAALACTLLG